MFDSDNEDDDEHEEQCCKNCFFCFPDPEIDDAWVCDNTSQIHRFIKLTDYCFYHEPLDLIP
jgi:hypothetical protein